MSDACLTITSMFVRMFLNVCLRDVSWHQNRPPPPAWMSKFKHEGRWTGLWSYMAQATVTTKARLSTSSPVRLKLLWCPFDWLPPTPIDLFQIFLFCTYIVLYILYMMTSVVSNPARGTRDRALPTTTQTTQPQKQIQVSFIHNFRVATLYSVLLVAGRGDCY